MWRAGRRGRGPGGGPLSGLTGLMQLTRHTDYALRVLIYLAHKEGELSTIAEISRSYGISENHLMKIVHQLARLGYVSTSRGKGGGLKLGRPPDQISLGEVVRNTEETLHVVECLANDYDGRCRLSPACRLKSVLHEAQMVFYKYLDQHTIADLAGKRAVFAGIQFHARPAVQGRRREKAKV